MPTLSTHDSMLLLVDMQAALLPAVHDHEGLLSRTERLLRAAQLLGVPVFATEHCADKIGVTCPQLGKLVDHVIHKTHFDATREAHFLAELPRGRSRILLLGAEAHICVLQTGLGLAQQGLAPVLVTDCIGSRRMADHAAACARWAHHRLESISAEMAMYEWLGTPAHPQFRDVLALVKAAVDADPPAAIPQRPGEPD
ncbi:isochorismatase family protein [Allopusillimonas soli]|uniref:Isochorismatase family protein n=1 Tax=Allopusillimonas soli TaxID=659016 RepID=A0A853F771_9BURK|nr:isochorismatase family protein [Allopusillimonas soli]NYT35668.1 isochorismatase family protein [Allopusillimonas soli]TEA76061.1 isochorismatase family protein [Allopusillimonas soli]